VSTDGTRDFRRPGGLIVAVFLIGAAAFPNFAAATDIRVVDGALSLTDSPGQESYLTLSPGSDGTIVVETKNPDDTLGSGCARGFNVTAECSGAQRIVASLGDQRDSYRAADVALPSTVDGGDGFDQIQTGAGADTLTGGPLGDLLEGGGGEDTLSGGDGDDSMFGGLGTDRFAGGAGLDSVRYDESDLAHSAGVRITLNGEADDGLPGEAENVGSERDIETVVGTAGSDQIAAGDEPMTIMAVGGNDSITGGSADDRLIGDCGEGRCPGARPGGAHEGVDGDDAINAGAGDDVILANDGDDKLNGGDGKDEIDGGNGAEKVKAADGAKDELDCGPEKKDRATIDSKDKEKGCESVRVKKARVGRTVPRGGAGCTEEGCDEGGKPLDLSKYARIVGVCDKGVRFNLCTDDDGRIATDLSELDEFDNLKWGDCAMSFRVDFGDGESQTVQDAFDHEYARRASYTASATVVASEGTYSDARRQDPGETSVGGLRDCAEFLGYSRSFTVQYPKAPKAGDRLKVEGEPLVDKDDRLVTVWPGRPVFAATKSTEFSGFKDFEEFVRKPKEKITIKGRFDGKRWVAQKITDRGSGGDNT
jgi:hypothetical protein